MEFKITYTYKCLYYLDNAKCIKFTVLQIRNFQKYTRFTFLLSLIYFIQILHSKILSHTFDNGDSKLKL
jgi:hypothetical protein